MTSPVVAARNTSQEPADTLTHTLALPSGIAAGHLLVGFLATDGGSNVLTWAGWTQLFQNNNAGIVQLACYYKVADGSEGSTVAVTSASTQQSAHATYRVTGYDTVQVPEVSAVANSTSATPNAGGVTPTGGSKDYLFLACCAIDTDVVITVAPTSYTNLQTATSTGAGGVGIGVAERALTTGIAENPDAFTAASSEDWHARTVVIHPGSGGATPTQYLEPVGMRGMWGP